MRFMIIRRADASTEAGVTPSGAVLSAMGACDQAMILELRPVFALSDFAVDPAEGPDGWRAGEQASRAGQAG